MRPYLIKTNLSVFREFRARSGDDSEVECLPIIPSPALKKKKFLERIKHTCFKLYTSHPA